MNRTIRLVVALVVLVGIVGLGFGAMATDSSRSYMRTTTYDPSGDSNVVEGERLSYFEISNGDICAGFDRTDFDTPTHSIMIVFPSSVTAGQTYSSNASSNGTDGLFLLQLSMRGTDDRSNDIIYDAWCSSERGILVPAISSMRYSLTFTSIDTIRGKRVYEGIVSGTLAKSAYTGSSYDSSTYLRNQTLQVTCQFRIVEP